MAKDSHIGGPYTGLIQKIASEDAIDSIVVAASGLEPLTPGL